MATIDNAIKNTPEQKTQKTHPSLEHMDSLIQETLQIYELESQRINTLDELVNTLKIITKFLGFSVTLPHNLLNLDDQTNITLLPNLNVIIIDGASKTNEKPIDSFTTDIIINILDYIIPKIVELVRNEKLKLLNSINFLRSGNDQLKKIENLGQLELNQNSVI